MNSKTFYKIAAILFLSYSITMTVFNTSVHKDLKEVEAANVELSEKLKEANTTIESLEQVNDKLESTTSEYRAYIEDVKTKLIAINDRLEKNGLN